MTQSTTNAIAADDLTLDGIGTLMRWRAADSGVPTVFVHGNPTHSADWLPFLERVDGPVIALDQPGFGRAERPSEDRFPGTMRAHADWLRAALAELEVDRYNLVVHDWGGVGLMVAQDEPDRVERICVINAVPLLPGYEWHWIARLWRRRGVGELLNRTTTKQAVRLLMRQARPGFEPMPDDFIEMVWECWDAGMADAVLRLYRSADPPVLEAAGARLDRLDKPALVVWGGSDPYLDERFGRAYAERLDAELLELPDAGHWPWIDRPEVVDRVAEFLAG